MEAVAMCQKGFGLGGEIIPPRAGKASLAGICICFPKSLRSPSSSAVRGDGGGAWRAQIWKQEKEPQQAVRGLDWTTKSEALRDLSCRESQAWFGSGFGFGHNGGKLASKARTFGVLFLVRSLGGRPPSLDHSKPFRALSQCTGSV